MKVYCHVRKMYVPRHCLLCRRFRKKLKIKLKPSKGKLFPKVDF